VTGPAVNIWYSEEFDSWMLSLPGMEPVAVPFSSALHALGKEAQARYGK
jgi:hypothetical protein